jgi:hypothetical protein
MAGQTKARVLSIRTGEEILARIDDFRRAQIAIPTQTEALKALVRLGFERWKEDQLAQQAR